VPELAQELFGAVLLALGESGRPFREQQLLLFNRFAFAPGVEYREFEGGHTVPPDIVHEATSRVSGD
jgi:hypothetical protein